MKFNKLVMPDKNSIAPGYDHRIRGLAKETMLYADIPKTEEETIIRIGGADAILTSWARTGRRVIESCPNLKYIGVMSTGYDSVDVKAATDKGITVTNVPHYSTESVAEIIMGALIAMSRNLIRADGNFRGGTGSKEELMGEELAGKTMGIIGLGAIGARVAELASAFGMKVVYHSRTRKDAPYEFCSMDDVFRKSDAVSVNYSLAPETERLVGERKFGLMKENAVFINFARARAVDEIAMLKHVKSGRIRLIADFIADPEVREEMVRLKDRTILTPHVGFYTKEAITRLTEITIKNMESFLEGEVQNKVN